MEKEELITRTRIGSGNSVTPSDITTSESQEFPKKREKRGAENLLNEGITENIPNLGRETDTQIQAAQRTPININKCRTTPGYVVIKLTK